MAAEEAIPLDMSDVAETYQVINLMQDSSYKLLAHLKDAGAQGNSAVEKAANSLVTIIRKAATKGANRVDQAAGKLAAKTGLSPAPLGGMAAALSPQGPPPVTLASPALLTANAAGPGSGLVRTTLPIGTMPGSPVSPGPPGGSTTVCPPGSAIGPPATTRQPETATTPACQYYAIMHYGGPGNQQCDAQIVAAYPSWVQPPNQVLYFGTDQAQAATAWAVACPGNTGFPLGPLAHPCEPPGPPTCVPAGPPPACQCDPSGNYNPGVGFQPPPGYCGCWVGGNLVDPCGVLHPFAWDHVPTADEIPACFTWTLGTIQDWQSGRVISDCRQATCTGPIVPPIIPPPGPPICPPGQEQGPCQPIGGPPPIPPPAGCCPPSTIVGPPVVFQPVINVSVNGSDCSVQVVGPPTPTPTPGPGSGEPGGPPGPGGRRRRDRKPMGLPTEMPVHWTQPGSLLFGANAQDYRDDMWRFLGIDQVTNVFTLDDLVALTDAVATAQAAGEPVEPEQRTEIM